MAENTKDGGFDVEFVTEPIIDVECVICKLTMRNPVQIVSCGHRFCERCIARHKNRYN